MHIGRSAVDLDPGKFIVLIEIKGIEHTYRRFPLYKFAYRIRHIPNMPNRLKYVQKQVYSACDTKCKFTRIKFCIIWCCG